MEAPERIGASVGAGGSAAWPRTGARAVRAAVQLWTWPMLAGVTLLAFAAALTAAIVLGRERAFAQGLHHWARAVLALGGCSVEVVGDVFSARGAVVAANHQGFGDVLVLAAVLPPPVRFAAREGLFRVPLLGTVLRAGRHLRVSRGGRVAARALVDAAADAAAAGCTVVFFPEGTRSREARIEPLRAGVFHAAAGAGCPLVPLVLSGTRHLWEPGTLRLLPSRVAVTVLASRRLDRARARGRRCRMGVRDEMAAKLRRLEPRTGPRV